MDKLMIAAVILVLTAQGYLRGPLCRRDKVRDCRPDYPDERFGFGLREFLGGLQTRPGQQAGQMEDNAAIIALWPSKCGASGRHKARITPNARRKLDSSRKSCALWRRRY
jgi:hypothetical protein